MSVEMLKKDSRSSSAVVRDFIGKLKLGGIAYVQGKTIRVDRLMLAMHALHLEGDPEEVCACLSWREFEKLATMLFDRAGYRCVRNLRFQHAGRKFEIDALACKGQLALSVDCKHWRRNLHMSSIKRIVEEQIERTEALREVEPTSLTKLGLMSWDGVRLIPAVLSLMTVTSRFFNSVPIVPVLRLADFLDRLPSHIGLVTQL